MGTVQGGAAAPESCAGAALARQPAVPTSPRQGQGSADTGTRIVRVLSPNSLLAPIIRVVRDACVVDNIYMQRCINCA